MNKYNNINWVDGMKINKTHFIHNDNVRAFQNQRVVSNFMSSHEFGLTRHRLTAEFANIYIEDHYLHLKYCNAINRNGLIIEMEGNEQSKIDLNDVDRSTFTDSPKLLVVIAVDPYSQIATGSPDPQELPPRQPFALPECKLSLVAPGQVKNADFGNHFVIIGCITKDGDRYAVDSTYLPPANNVMAHQTLINRYMSLEEAVADIGMHSTKVVQNARSKKRRGEINDLAENTFYLMEKIVFFLAQNMNHIRTLYKEESPIHLFSFLNSFGRVVQTALKCMKSVDREALLRYYESHLGFQPHQFEGDMQSLSQIEYDHMQLNTIFDEADRYLATLRSFATKATNLEFHSVERVDIVEEKTIKKSRLDIF